MSDSYWIDWFSLPAVFFLSIIFSMAAIYSGAKLSKLTQDNSGDVSGPVVGATLGLLAFVLAFTFNMAANRFDARKQLLLDEVNEINTAYLRTDLIPQPYRDEARKLIRFYVDLRIQADRKKNLMASIVGKSENVQTQLWSQVVRMNNEKALSVSQLIYLQSLNDLIDLQTKRVVIGLQTRIPSTIWIGLYLVAALAMIAVGYQFGHKQRSPVYLNLVLAMAFSAVLTLIADLDRATSGTVNLNQQPMIELQQKLKSMP